MAKKTRVKLGILAIITCVVCFSDCSFAQEIGKDSIEEFDTLLDFFVSILSWIWILFAKLAGIFLTNRWVYGEALKMDGLLWQYRNVTKNIANFGLGFYFVYIVFKGLIKQGKEDIVKNIKTKILWILIAGVGIQASWFFTAAMVDVSTITLVAVGSFPSQIIAGNENIQGSIENSVYKYFGEDKNNIGTGEVLDLFPKNPKSSEFIRSTPKNLKSMYESGKGEALTKEKFFDLLFPNPDDVSGPLYFMGFSILKTNEINSLNPITEKTLKGALFDLIIQCGTTIIYSIEMAVLCVLALMRLLYLWMFIVLSPIAIFLWCLKMSKDEDVLKWSFIEDLMKQINIKSFLINVFKPTIIVLGLGLAMIFASLMNGVINKNGEPIGEADLGGIKVTTRKEPVSNATETDLNYSTAIDGGTMKLTLTNVARGILEFIMCIITVILVYVVIKIAVKMGGGKDFVSQKIGKVQDAVQGVLEATPIVPVSGYDEETGRPTTHFISAGKVGSIFEGVSNKFQGKVQDEYNKQNQAISSWFTDDKKTTVLESEDKNKVVASSVGTGLGLLTSQVNKIRELGARPDDQGGLKSGRGYGMSLNPSATDTWRQERFKKWLSDMRNRQGEINGKDAAIWINMVNRWNKDENSKKGLEAMFKGNDSREAESVRAYAELFGLSLSSNTWNSLKDADFSVRM